MSINPKIALTKTTLTGLALASILGSSQTIPAQAAETPAPTGIEQCFIDDTSDPEFGPLYIKYNELLATHPDLGCIEAQMHNDKAPYGYSLDVEFKGGVIFYTPASGVHVILDETGMWDAYVANGYYDGVGFPTDDGVLTTNAAGQQIFTQTFQRKIITINKATGEVTVKDLAADTIDQKINETAAEYNLGARKGDRIQLDNLVSSVEFENGYVTYYVSQSGGESTEFYTPVEKHVYDMWTGKTSGASFADQVQKYGYPVHAYDESATPFEYQKTSGIDTEFMTPYAWAYTDFGTILGYVPQSDLVMDRTWIYSTAVESPTNTFLGEESLIASQDYRSTTPLKSAFAKAGYSSVDSYRLSGVGISAKNKQGVSIKTAVVDNGIALVTGHNDVITVQASAADANVPTAQLEADLRATIKKLKATYPGAKIVVSDVVSDGKNYQLNKMSKSLAKVSKEEGAGFIASNGWITQYKLQRFVSSTGVLSPEGQTRLIGPMKWAISHAVATAK